MPSVLVTHHPRDPPFWRRLGRLVFTLTPHRTGCSVAAASLGERSRSIPDLMPAVGPSLRPCAAGGRSAGRPAGCGRERDGERPGGRARCRAQHTNMRAGQDSSRPATLTRTHRTASHRSAACLVACPVLPEGPECRAVVCTTRRTTGIRARHTGGSPLKVIWLFRQRSRLPGLCWGNGLALSKRGCHEPGR
jgi:hypothetical protein